MAEGVGFEPTVACATLDFESSALNQAQPSLLTLGAALISGLSAFVKIIRETKKERLHEALFGENLAKCAQAMISPGLKKRCSSTAADSTLSEA